MNNRQGGFGAVCRQVMRVMFAGASLVACAPDGAIEDAPASATAALTTPETATVLRDGVAVRARVMASSPDAAGMRLWWITGEGVAIHAQALTLAAALEKGGAVEAGPAGANGTMSLEAKSHEGDDGEPWTLANMGIGGGR